MAIPIDVNRRDGRKFNTGKFVLNLCHFNLSQKLNTRNMTHQLLRNNMQTNKNAKVEIILLLVSIQNKLPSVFLYSQVTCVKVKTSFYAYLSFSTSTTLEMSSGALPDLLSSFFPASLCRASYLILLKDKYTHKRFK